ncbi:methionyl-tRNA formyltransferase [Bacillus horti]|uniref:Methionyl-tRNA formyltransferase n=1 Tax=Caldalkalibacillus horti TaxID=77523 RepID=A0ABT9VXI5_9BACI|nr:methionyl-tRNA formyltransferase [Bacillus horti]MDQ0165699.1 methionyl-tRNA formyltransferase [Bacillus horti]
MKIVFMGTPDFAVPSLDRLIADGYDVIGVVTQPDRPKGRKRTLTPPPVKEAALKHNLPVLQPERLKGSPEQEQLIEWAPDLIVTAAFGQLLPEEVLQLPKLGCINVHASLLPQYRGGAPIHQAIIDGQQETGVTIMYMVKALDAGDILTQRSLPILDDDNVATMFQKLSIVGAELLADTLPKLVAGELTPIPQDADLVTYAYNIKREDEEIDWTKSGKAIFNHVRGMNPFPGAYTVINGEVLKVWQTALSGDQGLTDSSGAIYKLDEQGIGVVAGDGQGVYLTEIQPAGKKRMMAADFLRGTGSSWSTGLRLGDNE